jgi:hypothetical protein
MYRELQSNGNRKAYRAATDLLVMRDTSSRATTATATSGTFFIVLFVKQLSVRNVQGRRTALLVGENRKRQTSVRHSIHRDVQQVNLVLQQRTATSRELLPYGADITGGERRSI